MKKVIFIIVMFLSFTQVIQSKDSINSNPVDGGLSTLQVTKKFASMPLTFTENQGHWDSKVKFRANAGGATMWFVSDGAYYQFTRTIKTDDEKGGSRTAPTSGWKTPSSAPEDMFGEHHQPDSIETMMIKANFVGANADPVMVGVDMLDYKCNYFIGNDESKWATNVPNYTAVMYEEIYDGIDLKYYGNGTQMEYDFIVEPGADFSQIQIQYEGAESVAVNSSGELVVTTMWGEVVEQRPVIYQIENNNRIAIDGSYLLQDDNSFSFSLSNYNPELLLVIDPVLVYSTYLGGNDDDNCYGIAVDSSGAVYLAGYTWSNNFPTLNAYQGAYVGSTSNSLCFVTKINPIGNALEFSTYIGGARADFCSSIAIDSEGNSYITGETNSTDYPLSNAIQAFNRGGEEVFILKLSSTGTNLIYSTYLGGFNNEKGRSIAVDASGNAYVTGVTNSTNFPTLNGFQNGYSGGLSDAFVTKIDSIGNSIVFSSYLGGPGLEDSYSIAVNNSGNAYITGIASVAFFPVTFNAYQRFHGGNTDAFVSMFSISGNNLVYSTFLGGSSFDHGYSITVDDSGCAYITGFTQSDDFPIYGEYQSYQGDGDVFVSKLNETGTELVFSTYLGGSNGMDYGHSIAVDNHSNTYITGISGSTDFPTINAIQANHLGGMDDAFLCKLDRVGNTLVYSTYFGGSGIDYTGNDYSSGIALDNNNNVYIAGYTYSATFPMLNPYQDINNGSRDVFIAKISEDIPTDIKEINHGNLPIDFKMSQNYPNPFNPTTTIEFNLPKKSYVTVTIYNLLGKEIQQLVNQKYSAGNYQVTWDGKTLNGTQTSSGIYFYRLETEDFVETKKMLLLK